MSEKGIIGKGMGIMALVLASLILLSSVAAAATLVAKYEFDEGAGDVLVDSSGYGHHGKIYGATWVDNGMHGKALLFDGIDDYIEIPDSPELSGGTGKNLTVIYSFNSSKPGGWIITKIQDEAFKEWAAGIGRFAPGVPPGSMFYYEKNHANNDMRFYGEYPQLYVWNRGGFTFQAANPTGTNTAKLKMYLNGLRLSLTFWNDYAPYSVSPDQLYDMPNTNVPVSIGYSGKHYNSGFFGGMLDAIYIYEGVLTDDEMNTDYENWVNPSSGIQVGENDPADASIPDMKAAFETAYANNGGIGSLGKPTTYVYNHTTFGYYVQEFPGVPGIDGGVIMYNPTKLEAFYLHGAIWQKYKNLPDTSILGAVSQDEMPAATSKYETTGNYSAFDNGRIHWIKSSTKYPNIAGESFVTYGALDAKYTALGGTNHWLGFPVEDQKVFENRFRQKFEGGWIYWNERSLMYEDVTKLIAIVPVEFSDRNHSKNAENLGVRADYMVSYYKEQSFENEKIGYKLYLNQSGNDGWFNNSENLMDIFGGNIFTRYNPNGLTCISPSGDCTIPDSSEFRLFSWDDVPGSDEARFRNNLKLLFGKKDNLDWIDSAKIEKKDNGNTIRIYVGVPIIQPSFDIKLNNERTWANLTSHNGKINADFLARTVNGKLNIYGQEKDAWLKYAHVFFLAMREIGLTNINMQENSEGKYFSPHDYDVGIVVYPNPKCPEALYNTGICRPGAPNYKGTGFILIDEPRSADPWAHEMGHIYGLDEEGSYKDGKTIPTMSQVGNWGIMEGGKPQNPPPPFILYDKERIGWIKNNTPANNFGSFVVRMINDSNLKAEGVLKFGDNNKYYIFEGRQPPYDSMTSIEPNVEFESKLKSDKGIEIYLVENNGAKISARYACPDTGISWFCFDPHRVTLKPGENLLIDGDSAIVRATQVGEELRVEIIDSSTLSKKIWNIKSEFYFDDVAFSIPKFGPERNIDTDLHAITLDGKRIGMNYETDEYYNEIEGANSSGNFMGTGEEWISLPDNVAATLYVTLTQDLKDALRDDPTASIEIVSTLTVYDEAGRSTQSVPVVTKVTAENMGSGLVLSMPVNVTFLPPLEDGGQLDVTDGDIVQVRFTARNTTTGEFISDETANINITNSTGALVANFNLSNGLIINLSSSQYEVDLNPADYPEFVIDESYNVRATLGNSDGLIGYASSSFKITTAKDTIPPEITITTPTDGVIYTLNQNVLANWQAVDPGSGIDSVTATVPNGTAINTATVGIKGFSVNATDNAGNQASKTAIYSVVYDYSGVLQPVNADNSSIFKLGSTVPVKFQLRDSAGTYVSGATAKIYIAKVSDGIVGTNMEATSTSAATTGNLFRYDAIVEQYIFNLATKPLSSGTWQIRIELDDGTNKYVNIGLR